MSAVIQNYYYNTANLIRQVNAGKKPELVLEEAIESDIAVGDKYRSKLDGFVYTVTGVKDNKVSLKWKDNKTGKWYETTVSPDVSKFKGSKAYYTKVQ